MIKKLLGVLFFLAAILALVGSVVNGSLFSDQGSAAATYGTFIGTMIPIILYTLSGIFLFTFDNVYKKSYIEGYRKRNVQSIINVIFCVVYVFIWFGSISSTLERGYDISYAISYKMSYALPISFLFQLPFMIPAIVFIFMISMYSMPYWKTKNLFWNNNLLKEYMSSDKEFKGCSKNNTIFINDKVLFFSKLCCIVPIEQIASIEEYKQLWEKGVYIHLNNGQKIYFITKEYDALASIFNSK